MTTVVSIYDCCKDTLERYPLLTRRALKEGQNVKEFFNKETGRGEGEKTDLGVPFWFIAGAESKGVVDEVSVLVREILCKMQ